MKKFLLLIGIGISFLVLGACSNNSTPIDECEKINTATIDDIKSVAQKMTLDTVYFLNGVDKSEVNNG